MGLLVVNYHYIHNKDKYRFLGIHPITPYELENQIKLLSKYFNILSQKDLLEVINSKLTLPENSCILTFDDGLRTQYENALPVLDKLQLPAFFFVNGLPICEKKACTVHKIHFCRANIAPNVFLKMVNEMLQTININRTGIENINEEVIRKRYQYDDFNTAKLKYTLNHFLEPKERNQVIGKIFDSIVDNESEWCKQFYISNKEIIELSRRGWLGIHSFSHDPLENLDTKSIKIDLHKNLDIIHKIVGKTELFSIAYPYGSYESVSKRVAEISGLAGMKIGFTMERAINKTIAQPLLLARFDTNDVPLGKKPLFDIKNGKITFKDKKYCNRNWFF